MAEAESGRAAHGQQAVKHRKRRPVLAVILILLAVIAAVYAWKEIVVARTRADARVLLARQNEELIRLVSVPLAWAVRDQMIRGNYDQINQYMANLVREPGFREVALAGPDGAIIVASDRNLEGRPAAESYPSSVLQADQTAVVRLEQKGLVAGSPVLGLNRKLGVLVVVYRPPSEGKL